MDEPRSDAEIIAASLVESELFAVIFQRHYKAIYRFVARAVGSFDGEEVAAEVFARAFTIRNRFDTSHSGALSWLFGIAVNVVRGHHRELARRSRAVQREGRRLSSSGGFEGEAVARVDASTQRPLIGRAIADLRPQEAEVVLLFVLGDRSYDEIAATLGIPVGTVRSRLSRGRSKLRNSLRPDGSGREP
ncbi:MAG: RNA polymerase sigma factor [Acidimicrobiia bacterium]